MMTHRVQPFRTRSSKSCSIRTRSLPSIASGCKNWNRRCKRSCGPPSWNCRSSVQKWDGSASSSRNSKRIWTRRCRICRQRTAPRLLGNPNGVGGRSWGLGARSSEAILVCHSERGDESRLTYDRSFGCRASLRMTEPERVLAWTDCFGVHVVDGQVFAADCELLNLENSLCGDRANRILGRFARLHFDENT